MKKVLYILNDGMRKFTYERIAGLQRAILDADEPINLYIARSDGYSGFSPDHNHGEYNIFRLPDYGDFDGIFLDINSNFSGDSNAYAAEGARYAVRAAAASGKPVITMANDVEGFYYVGIDNYAAMTSMICHLHGIMGLTDFWFAMGPEDNYENEVRTRALKDYCLANGLPCEDGRFYAESFIMECGVHAFGHFRERYGDRLPQAVICANDQIAVGVCNAARAAGLRVPQDFMVTGFDNLDVSAYLSPSVTTIDQLSWTMGATCVDTLCRIWRGEEVPRVIYTPTRLLLRESTGHPDPGQSDLKKRVTEFISRDSSTTEFSYRLSTLQYQLPGCESIEEICLALAECVSPLSCKGLRLVLDKELFGYGGFTDFSEDTNRVADATDRMLTEGYSDTMELVFAWEAGEKPRFPGKRAGSMLSDLKPQGPRENHLFVPLHFKAFTVGYLVIWNCVDLVRIRCVSALANTLTMALRSFFSRRKLAYVNHMLSGISMKDDLTELYNRLGYHNLAHRLFKRVNGEGGRLGILFIDMDRLKHLNDTYGHAAGDAAILCIANAIRRGIPQDAIPMRYGGDEFLVLMPVEDEAGLLRVIKAIVDAVPAEAEALGLSEAPEVSVGHVLTEPGAARTLDEYVEEADGLMYEKKRKHRAPKSN